VVQDLFLAGAGQVALADTSGYADPLRVAQTLEKLREFFDIAHLAMHFHDTRGLAMANVTTALELGVTCFDGSVGGLGGCPFIDGAAGNVASEELAFLMNRLGLQTGINLPKLLGAAQFALERLGKKKYSKLFETFQAPS
ncbi:MAG: hydroxymethylglutaryl-CoA lyase, partial [Pseudomonadota bacterium]